MKEKKEEIKLPKDIKIRPYNVLLLTPPKETKTATGIIIPNADNEQPYKGRILMYSIPDGDMAVDKWKEMLQKDTTAYFRKGEGICLNDVFDDVSERLRVMDIRSIVWTDEE